MLGRVFMFKLATVLLILIETTAARAAVPGRLVIIDAVGLTPELEKTNARQRMMDGVMATAVAHGWDAVASAGDCHDFTCVGMAAADAKARYALILSGRFVEGPLYATEVSASLWSDGSVIARRTEADEQAEFDKSGVGIFFACGPPSGTCTVPLLTTKLQQYAGRLLDAEATAIRQRDTVVSAAARPALSPVATGAPIVPEATDRSEGGGGRILGWSLLGGSALLGAGGVVLWTYDNSGTGCHDVAGSGCREIRHTAAAAALAGGVGIAAAIAGIVVLVLDRGPSRVALSASPGGLVLGGLF
jgi:hypothetical protein